MNFDLPYFATSIARVLAALAHQRCRTWLRDYLYIPLGGNRGGRAAHVPQPDARPCCWAACGTARAGPSWSGAHPRPAAVRASLDLAVARPATARPPRRGVVLDPRRVLLPSDLHQLAAVPCRRLPTGVAHAPGPVRNLDGGLYVVGRYHLQTLLACAVALFTVDGLDVGRRRASWRCSIFRRGRAASPTRPCSSGSSGSESTVAKPSFISSSEPHEPHPHEGERHRWEIRRTCRGGGRQRSGSRSPSSSPSKRSSGWRRPTG